jgi:hypothetical protein
VLNKTDIIAGLPTDGRQVYVRLFSYINGAWQYTDTQYTAAALQGPLTKAQILTPPATSTLPSGPNTFTWSTGTGVSAYYLFVGTSIGNNDIYAKFENTATSDTVNLPANKTIFVRLWSYLNGAYQAADYAYSTGN